MPVSCPKCGSRLINLSRLRSARERIGALFGTRPLRCGDCRTRFIARTFAWRDHLFSHCPRCFRMDLNLWQPGHFHASGWMRFLLQVGGFRYRCEYCRLNFVSLRRRKERFSFKRWTARRKQGDRNRA